MTAKFTHVKICYNQDLYYLSMKYNTERVELEVDAYTRIQKLAVSKKEIERRLCIYLIQYRKNTYILNIFQYKISCFHILKHEFSKAITPVFSGTWLDWSDGQWKPAVISGINYIFYKILQLKMGILKRNNISHKCCFTVFAKKKNIQLLCTWETSFKNICYITKYPLAIAVPCLP